MKFTRQHPLITGTLLLTATGFLSRIIGFFYRIYLSRLFGEEGMGIYQLIHPVIALAFSLTAAAFQTAISKLVAEQTGTDEAYKPLVLGAAISLPLSLIAAATLYAFAEPIAHYYLGEPRTTHLLRLLAFTLPFSAAHACINGYFYGIKKASVPAWTQLLEQFFRVGVVFLLASPSSSTQNPPSLSIAVVGLIIGEIAGLVGAILVLLKKRKKKAIPDTSYSSYSSYSLSAPSYGKLLALVIPLTANRVILNALQSVEAVSLPSCLKTYGYDTKTALSVYGVLTGMAFPLIFFPNALTGSLSVLLLPSISENMAQGKKSQVKHTIVQTIQYCSVMGFLCMAFFLFFGKTIGNMVFQSTLAGYFICELSFLCPFLYLNSTLSGILQGMGMVTGLFVSNVSTLLLRLVFILGTVPRLGMQGYLWGLLISQILQTVLYLSMLLFRKTKHAVFQKKLAPFLEK